MTSVTINSFSLVVLLANKSFRTLDFVLVDIASLIDELAGLWNLQFYLHRFVEGLMRGCFYDLEGLVHTELVNQMLNYKLKVQNREIVS